LLGKKAQVNGGRQFRSLPLQPGISFHSLKKRAALLVIFHQGKSWLLLTKHTRKCGGIGGQVLFMKRHFAPNAQLSDQKLDTMKKKVPHQPRVENGFSGEMRLALFTRQYSGAVR
jgi:hypothetical protein